MIASSALFFSIAITRELWGEYGLHVRGEDFTLAATLETASEKFNLNVCNPPYVRHHHLDSDMKKRLKHLVYKRLGLSVNGLAGLYCYFILLADKWLANKGVALWLVPAEFLDVNYGAVLREYLTSKVTLHRIHRFDPEDVQFFDALVSSCVVVFEKHPCPPKHKVNLSSGGTLLKPNHTALIPIVELKQTHKWGQLIAFPQIDSKVNLSGRWLTIGDLFEIKRGIATGANKFFILELEKAKELGLPNVFLQPVLPSSRYINTDLIEADEMGWPLGLPHLVLLKCDLPRHQIKQLYPALDAYLRTGEDSGLTDRYLLRKRSPWYLQEARPPAPILFTYMGRRKEGGHTFRFLRNYSRATATNVYLMLYPKPWLSEIEIKKPKVLDQVFSALQRISDQKLLSGGRTYGGGLNKLEPRELAKIRLTLHDVDLEAFRERKTNQLERFIFIDRNGG